MSKLFVALDTDSGDEANHIITNLEGVADGFKIGHQLMMNAKWTLLADIMKQAGFEVMLDLKLYDTPDTVSRTVSSVANGPFDYVTVHHECIIPAAVGSDMYSDLKILGVLGLTTDSHSPLVPTNVPPLAQHYLDGMIVRPDRVDHYRAISDPGFVLACPGIRLPNSDKDGHSATMTPNDASAADIHIVGRPIMDSEDPVKAAIEFKIGERV